MFTLRIIFKSDGSDVDNPILPQVLPFPSFLPSLVERINISGTNLLLSLQSEANKWFL